MKKIIALVLAALLLMSAAALVSAEEAVTVYVTISNLAPVAVATPVTLTDADGDQALTINDALILIHDESFEGGAEAGFATVDGDYGAFITKLWGVENGGSYGYYVNDEMAFSLTQPLSDGDRLYAYVFTDTITYSDAYSYFDKSAVDAKAGEEVTLTLYYVGFDENWMPVSYPLSGAVITFDAAPSDYVTDENGSVTLVIPEDANWISALSDTLTLVAPVCVINK